MAKKAIRLNHKLSADLIKLFFFFSHVKGTKWWQKCFLIWTHNWTEHIACCGKDLPVRQMQQNSLRLYSSLLSNITPHLNFRVLRNPLLQKTRGTVKSLFTWINLSHIMTDICMGNFSLEMLLNTLNDSTFKNFCCFCQFSWLYEERDEERRDVRRNGTHLLRKVGKSLRQNIHMFQQI